MAARERRKGRAELRRDEKLGPIIDVPPARGYRDDHSPKAGADQAYVIGWGTVYHPVWCRTVGERWDVKPKSLHVVERATVGKRTECRTCANDGPIGD